MEMFINTNFILPPKDATWRPFDKSRAIKAIEGGHIVLIRKEVELASNVGSLDDTTDDFGILPIGMVGYGTTAGRLIGGITGIFKTMPLTKHQMPEQAINWIINNLP